MMDFVQGLVAGYGIAIPVGAVSVLIFTTGMRSGFATGFMAGAGAATADLIYATAASVAGTALVLLLQPIARELRIAGAAVLIGLGAYGVVRAFMRRGTRDSAAVPGGLLRAYGQLVGITIVNPLTVVYFAALVIGRDPGGTPSFAGRLLFVLGAALASLSWQTLIAGLGSIAHNRIPERFRLLATIGGNAVVVGLGARMLVRTLV